MVACHAKATISLEMDSELEESEILQCTPPSIVIQLYISDKIVCFDGCLRLRAFKI